jgi:GNAT superfamily N-acetyltransferase
MSAAVSSPSLPVTFRELDRSNSREVNFVAKSWAANATSNRPAKVWADRLDIHGAAKKIERMAEHAFYVRLMHAPSRVMYRLIERSRVVVACANSAPRDVAGFVAYEPPTVEEAGTLHFLYVARDLRRMGLGRMLIGRLPQAICTHTFWAPDFDLLRLENWTWRPDLLLMMGAK